MIEAVREAIHGRRSIGKAAPDPLPRELIEDLLSAAVAAPNHKLTAPWRFVVLAGSARGEVGRAHAAAVVRSRPDHPEAGLVKEAARLERAPVVVACICRPSDNRVMAREDRDAVAAGVQNLLLMAHAHGLAAIWRTGVMADEPEVCAALNMGPEDQLVGLVYLGRPVPDAPPPNRPARPDLEGLVDWRGL